MKNTRPDDMSIQLSVARNAALEAIGLLRQHGIHMDIALDESMVLYGDYDHATMPAER